MANNLTLATLAFLNNCEQAQFDTGNHIHFRITFQPAIGEFITWISDKGGAQFFPIVNEHGIVTYDTFAEALNAIVEHKREM